jgi:hypothetical protein
MTPLRSFSKVVVVFIFSKVVVINIFSKAAGVGNWIKTMLYRALTLLAIVAATITVFEIYSVLDVSETLSQSKQLILPFRNL